MKLTKIALSFSFLLASSCGSKSESKKDQEPSLAPAPAPAPAGDQVKGFEFVSIDQKPLAIYLRGLDSKWYDVGDAPTEAYKLNFNKETGCYSNVIALQAGDQTFKPAAFIDDKTLNSGWNLFKAAPKGSASGSDFQLVLGTPASLDVFYFADGVGNDSGGGGNFKLLIETAGSFEFKLCTNPTDYTLDASLTVSKK